MAAGVLATWERALVDIGTAINYNPKRPMEAPKTKTFAARPTGLECGCSSGVEHNLAKVRVEGSNPFARSNFLHNSNPLTEPWLAGTLAAAVAGQHPAPELCWASKPMTACRTNAPFHRSSFLARSLVARAEIWDLGVEVPKGHG